MNPIERSSRALLESAYTSFNQRAIDSVLQLMHPDVAWPNGMEGGYVHGHAEVRAYWLRQWQMIDPHVHPVDFSTESDGSIAVTVHQVIRDLKGQLLADQNVRHIYSIDQGLIRTMRIETTTEEEKKTTPGAGTNAPTG